MNAQVVHLLSVQRATATVEDSQATGKSSLSGYNEVVITKNVETTDAFSSYVIPMKAEKAHTGERINVITHALQAKDQSLPTNLLEGVEGPHSLQVPKLTVRQRQGKMFQELDLGGLESWPPELVDSA